MKLHVVEVLATLRRAGAERIAVSLACRLNPDRFETTVISLFNAFPGGFEDELAAQGVRCIHLGKRRGFDPRMYGKLTRILRQLDPAILHSHSYLLRYTFPAGMAARVPVMVHTVHNLAEREVDALGRAVHRFAFRAGVKPVAVAGEVARSFRGCYGFDVTATIPNGVDLAALPRAGDRAQWRRANGFDAGDLLVVSVARLEPQKNPLGLIDAFARLAGSGAPAHLLIAGDGSLRNAARQHSAQLGLEERVHLLGNRVDVAEVLAASDVFALASHWEGNPVAVMEAMAAGLPVVATGVGGVPEVVEDGVSGVLVPAGDAGALAAALCAVTADQARRSALSAAARDRAARFSIDEMVDSYAALFGQLTGAPQ